MSAPPDSADTRGDLGALVPEAYAELRTIARALLARERPGHTLDPTALVNELYLRFERRGAVALNDRAHFLALAAAEMRRALVAHARRKRAAKRGGGETCVTLGELDAPHRDGSRPGPTSQVVDLLALDRALERLGVLDADACRLVEMRFFAGLTMPEIADVVGKTERTVFRRLAWAKTWLLQQLDAPVPG